MQLWPYRTSIWTICAWVLAVAFFFGAVAVEYAITWSFAERQNLQNYVLANTLGWFIEKGRYPLLFYVDRTGREVLVKCDEAEAVTLPDGSPGFRLTEKGLQAGAVGLRLIDKKWPSEGVRSGLRKAVYQDTWHYIQYPTYGAALVLILGLCVAIPADDKRARLLKSGRVIEGPLLVSGSEFNRSHPADGVGFVNYDRGLTEKLLGTGKRVHIPRAEESSHMLLLGDTGTGKSAVIRHLLDQIEERGEAAIIYDAKPEYVTQYYRPERGDVILNPLDARMPYWNLGAEIENEAEAFALATAAIKEDPHDKHFFIDTAREVLAELLKYRPTPQELTQWLCNPEEIDKRMKGTAYESSLKKDAPQQRGGVFGSLALVYKSFRGLPTKEETTRTWDSVQWNRERHGWIFITSKAKYRDNLRPLDSLWLDMLVLRLMSDRRADARRTWFMLDEVATLNKLPQLHSVLAEGRDSGNPVVVGSQGRSQLEKRYGGDAETMLSQPKTRIFLRTGDPRAAEWVSKAIGWPKKEYLKESYTNDGQKQRRTYSLETKPPEALVIDSDISGLKSFVGYLRREDMVVRLSFEEKNYQKPAPRHPDFVERKTKPLEKAQAAAVGGETPFFE